jgi:mannitol/fructose-specific phosphotransferase system IIA component (Ntr-type)
LTELINKIKTEYQGPSKQQYSFAIDDFYNEIKSDFILKGDAIEFKKKLYMYFREKNISVEYNEALEEQIKRKGLLELLENKILLNNDHLNWKEAVVKASTPLLDEGSISEGYIDEIFNLVESKGPYFIITPGVALVHSKPSESVHKTSIALMVSKESIAFNEEKSVKIMIMLALKDKKEHLLAMTDILTLFEKDETVHEIIEQNSVEAISHFLLNYLKK